MDSPNFEGCKKDYNWDVCLALFLDCCIPEIELRFHNPINTEALINSNVLNALNRGVTESDGISWVSFRIDETYDPIKVAFRVSEWLANQGYEVSIDVT